MEVIKEVLIIEANGLRVKAFIVENLPKELVYHKTKKLMPLDEYSERLVPCFEIDANGKKRPTGELVDALNPGITEDGAGSGGLVFDLFSDDSIQALRRIDKYLEDQIKDPAFRPARQPYAQVPMDPKSPPKPYSQIVRVRLPEPPSPPTIPVVEEARAVPEVAPKTKRVYTEEQKKAMRDRMAAARAKKAQQ